MKVMWYKKVDIPLSRTGYIIQKTGNITTNTKYRQSSSQKKSDKRGIPKNTMYGWVRANWLGTLDLGAGSQTPQSAMMLNGELVQLRQQVKEQEKEIRRLKKKTTFWRKPV